MRWRSFRRVLCPGIISSLQDMLRKPLNSILTVQELHKRREQRAIINHETYKKLYRICTTVIEGLQHIRPPVTSCSWVVPEHIMWRPPYKQDHAVRYIRDKLQHYGFSVGVRNQFTLDIDWEKTKKKRNKKKKTTTLGGVTKKKVPPPPQSLQTRLAEMAARAERITGKLRVA